MVGTALAWTIMALLGMCLLINLIILTILGIMIADVWMFRTHLPHWEKLKQRARRKSKLKLIKGDKNGKNS